MATTPHKVPDLLTVSQVADRFNVGRSTVTRMIADGRLTPTARLPGGTGAYLFDRAEIEATAKKYGTSVRIPKASA